MSKTLLCFLGLWFLLSLNCSSSKGTTQPTKEDLQKIKFNLNQLDEEGLQGPEGGKVALNYEFCIPNAPTFIKEAQRDRSRFTDACRQPWAYRLFKGKRNTMYR
jgi:hypothetical protein